MAKLVTKFKYYKPHGKKNFGGYAKYIALRNGAELLPDSKKGLPSSLSQKQLIEKILKDFPDSADMLEYDDYVRNPTTENASEFLYRAIEDNFQSATSISTYADYIATRPRAEKIGKHGLFSNEGDEIVLSQVSAELNRHEGKKLIQKRYRYLHRLMPERSHMVPGWRILVCYRYLRFPDVSLLVSYWQDLNDLLRDVHPHRNPYLPFASSNGRKSVP